MNFRFSSILIAALLCGASLIAQAQTAAYPSRPIKVVVPYPPGGISDAVTRLVSNKLAEQLAQTVIVENKPGANSIIGADFVAKSPADGYTFLVVVAAHSINPSVYAKLPYDTLKDFAPVSLFGNIPLLAVATNHVPAADVKEFIAYAKANPGQLNFASSGTGSGAHLAGELFKLSAGIDMVHVPYKGMGPALPDLIAGRVSLIFDSVQTMMPLIREKRIRGLAISSAKRWSAAPEIPTMEEAGLPGFIAGSWIGMLTTGGTPQDIVNRVSAEIAKALNSPELRERFLSFGIETVASTPDEFNAHIRAEMEKWAKVVKQANIKPE